MLRIRRIRRTLARAASLLAVLTLVLALVQVGPAALAAAVGDGHAGAAQAIDACEQHAARHETAHHHAHAAPASPDADAAQPGDGPASDPAQHHPHHTHSCCIGSVCIVLPALAPMGVPLAPGGHRVMSDVAERLEKYAPEGPNEPPRPADRS